MSGYICWENFERNIKNIKKKRFQNEVAAHMAYRIVF
jgi:hypothetical protein